METCKWKQILPTVHPHGWLVRVLVCGLGIWGSACVWIQLCVLLAEQFRTRDFTAQSLSFLICKMEQFPVPLAWPRRRGETGGNTAPATERVLVPGVLVPLPMAVLLKLTSRAPGRQKTVPAEVPPAGPKQCADGRASCDSGQIFYHIVRDLSLALLKNNVFYVGNVCVF